jgi:hypothetical protein
MDHHDVVPFDEGWTVNNQSNAGFIEVGGGRGWEEDILDALVEAGLMDSPEAGDYFQFGGDDMTITVDGPMVDGTIGPYFTLTLEAE